MADWVALEPPADQPDKDIVFVRDNFRWLGLIAPPLWLAWHRLWLEAALAVALLVGINVLAESGWFTPTIGLLSTLVGLFVGLEGPAMRIAGLRRKGYREAVALSAADIDEAELRYLDWLGVEDEIEHMPVIEAQPQRAGDSKPRHQAPALGLFSYPGRN